MTKIRKKKDGGSRAGGALGIVSDRRIPDLSAYNAPQGSRAGRIPPLQIDFMLVAHPAGRSRRNTDFILSY